MIDPTPWAHRPHPGPRTVPLELSADQRMDLEAALRPDKAENRIVRRAQAVLFMAAWVPASDIAKVLGVHPRTVEKWRVRFSCQRRSIRCSSQARIAGWSQGGSINRQLADSGLAR